MSVVEKMSAGQGETGTIFVPVSQLNKISNATNLVVQREGALSKVPEALAGRRNTTARPFFV